MFQDKETPITWATITEITDTVFALIEQVEVLWPRECSADSDGPQMKGSSHRQPDIVVCPPDLN